MTTTATAERPTRPSGAASRTPASRLARVVRLSAVHARFTLIETVRVPIAIIGSLVFPALALVFFVVPQRAVADDALFATQAVISLSVFAVMSNGLFGFGVSLAESREKPWDPYLRTLPAPGIVRIAGLVIATGGLGMVSILPVVLVGALMTEAEASIPRLLLGLLVLAVTALPTMLIGIVIGLSFPAKAAIAVVQIVMFGFGFGGGLFLPPVMFPGWLDVFSRFLPTRQARELVVWAVQGGELDWWAPVGIAVWSIVLLVVALVLFRRDEGRRFR